MIEVKKIITTKFCSRCGRFTLEFDRAASCSTLPYQARCTTCGTWFPVASHPLKETEDCVDPPVSSTGHAKQYIDRSFDIL